jgi:hypothetical protein
MANYAVSGAYILPSTVAQQKTKFIHRLTLEIKVLKIPSDKLAIRLAIVSILKITC